MRVFLLALVGGTVAAIFKDSSLPPMPLKVNPPPIASDKSVKWDYDIVYVRAPRFRGTNAKGKKRRALGGDRPSDHAPPGADLMLLHPDGSEEVLVAGGRRLRADPYVSFDGQWVYYSTSTICKAGQWTAGGRHLQDPRQDAQDRAPDASASRRPTPGSPTGRRLSHAGAGQDRAPNGVYNMRPLPAAGRPGRLHQQPRRLQGAARLPERCACNSSSWTTTAATSRRSAISTSARALHPVVLKDGRIIFSSLESQGLRSDLRGASGHPSRRHQLGPGRQRLRSGGAADAFHFQTQLSDGSIVVEKYYNQNNARLRHLLQAAAASARRACRRSAPAYTTIRATDAECALADIETAASLIPACRSAPCGMEVLTRFAHGRRLARRPRPIRKDPKSPARRQVHAPVRRAGQSPADRLVAGRPVQAAIDDRSHRPAGRRRHLPDQGRQADLGAGRDAAHQERPEVQRASGRGRSCPTSASTASTSRNALAPLANDGKLSAPAGGDAVRPGRHVQPVQARELPLWRGAARDSVTATRRPLPCLGGSQRRQRPRSCSTGAGQGADAGLYDNSDIHAIRILAMEPATSRWSPAKFHNHASERLRILGEIPRPQVQPRPKGQANPSTPTATRTPASSPRSRPTWP